MGAWAMARRGEKSVATPNLILSSPFLSHSPILRSPNQSSYAFPDDGRWKHSKQSS